jgi:hypothetical protein
MKLHADMQPLLGFEWKGVYYEFTHLPFGVGPAPKAYTMLKQIMHWICRTQGGIRMTSFIDDTLSLASGQQLAQFQQYCMLVMQWALGFTLSVHKCVLEPTTKLDFLGLQVDLAERKFWIPDHKVLEFKELVYQLFDHYEEHDGSAPAKLVAKLAGKLISFQPALQRAKLYARPAHETLLELNDWDGLVRVPNDLLQALEELQLHIQDWNGALWEYDRPALTLAGDWSSSYGYGIFTPDGQFAHPMVITHSADEQQAIAAGKFSSAGRAHSHTVYTQAGFGHRPNHAAREKDAL